MRTLMLSFFLAPGCGEESDLGEDTAQEADADTDADTDSDTDADTDADTDDDPHPLGEEVPSFALEDVNPTSNTYAQVVDSESLAGTRYALIFLDSRCAACPDVADDLWATYEANPGWWEALPTYAVQSWTAAESAPSTIDDQVDGNDLPYLVDTEEQELWVSYDAFNHDFFVVSEEGSLEAWLAMYLWPEDLSMFTDYMTDTVESSTD